MYEQRRPQVLWDRVALAIILVIVIFAGVWWIESRFSATVALFSLGSIAGVVIFALGIRMNQQSNKAALENAADFLHETSAVYGKSMAVSGHYARMERDAFDRRSKIDIMDAKQTRLEAKQSGNQPRPSYEFESTNDVGSEADFIQL